MPVKLILNSSTKGGPGSGNFGHSGRSGKIGGSAPKSGGSTKIGTLKPSRAGEINASMIPTTATSKLGKVNKLAVAGATVGGVIGGVGAVVAAKLIANAANDKRRRDYVVNSIEGMLSNMNATPDVTSPDEALSFLQEAHHALNKFLRSERNSAKIAWMREVADRVVDKMADLMRKKREGWEGVEMPDWPKAEKAFFGHSGRPGKVGGSVASKIKVMHHGSAVGALRGAQVGAQYGSVVGSLLGIPFTPAGMATLSAVGTLHGMAIGSSIGSAYGAIKGLKGTLIPRSVRGEAKQLAKILAGKAVAIGITYGARKLTNDKSMLKEMAELSKSMESSIIRHKSAIQTLYESKRGKPTSAGELEAKNRASRIRRATFGKELDAKSVADKVLEQLADYCKQLVNDGKSVEDVLTLMDLAAKDLLSAVKTVVK